MAFRQQRMRTGARERANVDYYSARKRGERLTVTEGLSSGVEANRPPKWAKPLAPKRKKPRKPRTQPKTD